MVFSHSLFGLYLRTKLSSGASFLSLFGILIPGHKEFGIIGSNPGRQRDLSRQKRVHSLIKEWVKTDLGITSAYIVEGTGNDLCIMVVNSASSPGSFLPFYFQGENGEKEISVEVHPSDLPFIFDQSIAPLDLKMPSGWKIGNIVFNGLLIYDDVTELISDLKEFPYLIDNDDDPLMRRIGFKCKELGRSWHIDIKHIKEAPTQTIADMFKTPESREKLLEELNVKPKAIPFGV